MTKFSNLKVGDHLSEQQFYTVEKIVGNEVQLGTNMGEPIVVNKDYVEKLLQSTQFSKTVQVTKTEAANILLRSSGVVLEVSFNKQVKPEDVVKEVMDSYNNSTPTTLAANLKKVIKKGLEGEERTLKGYHSGEVNEFGRIQMIDMSIPKIGDGGNRFRQVDPRGLNYIIVKGVFYKVK